MPASNRSRWVCAQIGSREHYAIPRVIHAESRLRLLLTDYWSAGRKARGGGATAAKVAQRFHPELANAAIAHLGWRRILYDLAARFAARDAWRTVMGRNAWFQRSMLRRLRPHADELRANPGVFFSYSYAALALARFFRELGWKTVLGQIDPGIREEEIVAAAFARHPESKSGWKPAPPEYWRLWREECALCDRIVVNSPWSRDALIASGIPAEKIRIIPLAYATRTEAPPARDYPAAFTAARPLRVLFLGQIILRKGAHLMFEAMRRLADRPIEWHFVGPAEMDPPAELRNSPALHWSGPVARSTAEELYRTADVFLLPTLSDGFALTQLEAQAAGLPVLASRYCGAVVRDGVNGWLIDPLDGPTLGAVIQRAVEQPATLRAFAQASRVHPEFSFGALRTNLLELEHELHLIPNR